jgi:hypothetical protein
MRTARILWLIVLVLVAVTLPPSVKATPPRKAPAAPDSTPGDSSPANSSEKKNRKDKLRIAPTPELWDASLTRTAGKLTQSAVTPALATSGHTARIVAPTPLATASQDEPAMPLLCLDARLIGHYAHAPPTPAV